MLISFASPGVKYDLRGDVHGSRKGMSSVAMSVFYLLVLAATAFVLLYINFLRLIYFGELIVTLSLFAVFALIAASTLLCVSFDSWMPIVAAAILISGRPDDDPCQVKFLMPHT